MNSTSTTPTPATTTSGHTPFQLLRHFSVASSICIAIVIALLSHWDDRTRTRELFALGDQNNQTITQALLHALWPDLREQLRNAPRFNDEALRTHPHTVKLNDAVSALVRDGSTAKIKFYDLQGRTLYSSELAQIGQSQAGNAAFKAALMGATTTTLNHRESLEVFGKPVEKRELLSTYLPVRSTEKNVVAVLEVHDDVTPIIARLRESGRQFLIGAAVILLMLYGVLFLIVRRADRIMRDQQKQRGMDLQALTTTQSNLAQAHRDMIASDTQIRLVNDALPVMIAYIDCDETFRYVNARYCSWRQLKPEDIVDHTVRDIHGARFYPLFCEDFAKVRAGERVSSAYTYVARSGGVVDVAYTYIPRIGDAGEVIGFHTLVQDISEQKNTERALLAAKSAAEAANLAKSRFLANMSHEIRTPMNGVLGMAEMLLTEKLNPVARGYADTIRGSGESLLHIINDILDFSKIEAGKLDLETIAFDLHAALRATVAMLEQRAGEKGIRLDCHIADGVPHAINGDPTRLRQILMNLLSNAIKFTDHGSVTLNVRRLEAPPAQDSAAAPSRELRFEVTDTGMGMTPEALGRLFQPFSQADESTTRRFGGTGLGLAISKQLVEIMGGAIGVQSEAGRGSTFWLTLPAHIVDLPDTPQITEHPDTTLEIAARTHRVLLVEDNAVNQAVARAMLGTFQCAAEIRADGAQAVAAATTAKYDLILMDCNMPVLDGWEATRQIRAWEAVHRPNGRTPIVALTANALQGDREQCLAAGMDDFLSKPFNRDELREILTRWAGNTFSIKP